MNFKRLTRPTYALMVNSLSSAGNLALTVSIARSTNVQGVGQYALAFAIYTVVTGLARAAVTEGRLADTTTGHSDGVGSNRLSGLALLAAVPLLAIGLFTGSPYLLLLSVTVHGLTLYSHVKTLDIAVGSVKRALYRESAWTAVVLSTLGVSVVFPIAPYMIFLIWGFTGALLGYSAHFGAFHTIRPRWNYNEADPVSLPYAFDYLVGSGSTQLSMVGLGVSGATATLGAIRSAATLLSPASLLASTARSLAIRPLARRRGLTTEYAYAVRAAAILAAFTSPLCLVAVLLPDQVGQALLGDSWKFARPVLIPLALEAVLGAATTIAFAGHRAHHAGRETLLIRLSLAPLRIVAVIFFGTVHGPAHAAWAMVSVSLVGLGTWWFSYNRIIKREST